MRKRHKKSKNSSQLHLGSLGRRKPVTRSASKKSRDTLITQFKVPKFTTATYVEQYVKSKARLKSEGDFHHAHKTVPEGVQTDEVTDEEEQAKLEVKLRAREENVRANTIKVLHWLFEKTDTKNLHEVKRECEEEYVWEAIGPGILGLLTPKEFSMIRYPEWRLVINGNQFNIMANEDGGDSFYRALAQAITSNEDNADVIRRQLCLYVTDRKWGMYETRVRNYYLKQNPSPITSNAPARTVTKLYKQEHLKEQKPGGYFQLRVAADMHNFNFVLVFKKRSSVKWFTFTNSSDSRKSVAFFVWPIPSGDPLWKVLEPLDSTNIEDGEYPFFIKRTFVVQQCCFGKSSTPTIIQETDDFPGFENLKLITLQAGTEEFVFPINNLALPQTLYSLLSQVFFGNSYHADEIRTEILEHRDRFEYFINLNPKRKNSRKKLFSSHYRQDWGDAVDLKIAASIYKFCYTVIAMDRLGNLPHTSECRDRTHSHYSNRHDINFLAFFTRVTPRSLTWFKLELFDSSQNFYSKVNDVDTKALRSEYFTLSKHRGPSTIIQDELYSADIPQSNTRIEEGGESALG